MSRLVIDTGEAMRHQTDHHEQRADGRRAIPKNEFRHFYGGISNTTFHELVNRGELKVRHIGRRTYVDSDEAERWWASCAQGPR